MIRVFVGYDPREAIAYHVFCNSVLRHASEPVSFVPLALNAVGGSRRDGSNDFVYSRFLVPYLCDFSGHAIYADGDMVCTGDIAELWGLRRYDTAVQVVKHDYVTRHGRKYLGAENVDYPRKNWSSVILWNCRSYHNRGLTPEFVAEKDGAYLHRFSWLDDAVVGGLPAEWNWLVSEYYRRGDAKLYHYTIGAPCFAEYAGCDNADVWFREKELACQPS